MEPNMRGPFLESIINEKTRTIEAHSKVKEDEKSLMPLEL